MKPAFILGSASISPQPAWDADPSMKPVSYSGTRLRCVEPAYQEWIDIKHLRRMSRIMQMGAGAAMMALKNSGISKPDAIITGTGYGCLEDTGTFLGRMIGQGEVALNPTPFMQSTHNTIGSQLAILLQCQGYNQTYTHGPFSFESALLDGMLQLEEAADAKVLVGAADEVTDASHAILSRFGILKRSSSDSLQIFNSGTKGTLNGEGTAWFVLSGNVPSAVSIHGVRTLYQPTESIEMDVDDFLSTCNMRRGDVDLVLCGKSGDMKLDAMTTVLVSALFRSSSSAVFKHLCGEYPCASSFALWLAHRIIETNKIPDGIVEVDKKREPRSILIYNRYFNDHHTLILVRHE